MVVPCSILVHEHLCEFASLLVKDLLLKKKMKKQLCFESAFRFCRKLHTIVYFAYLKDKKHRNLITSK